MKKTITKLKYNFFQSGEGDTLGEDYYAQEVGKNCIIEKSVCIKITEHMPEGGLDVLYYDMFFENGTEIRTYNPNEVTMKPS